MAKKPDDQYSDKEAQHRFEATLRGALNTPPAPLKSMAPKRSKAQRARKTRKPSAPKSA
jgi:hypothetical protein